MAVGMGLLVLLAIIIAVAFGCGVLIYLIYLIWRHSTRAQMLRLTLTLCAVGCAVLAFAIDQRFWGLRRDELAGIGFTILAMILMIASVAPFGQTRCSPLQGPVMVALAIVCGLLAFAVEQHLWGLRRDEVEALILGASIFLLIGCAVVAFRKAPALTISDPIDQTAPSPPDRPTHWNEPVRNAKEDLLADAIIRPASRPRQPAPDPAEFAPHFPDLDILGLIGQGGMGAVYRVKQKSDDHFFALKVVRSEPGKEDDFAARFDREAEALTRLDHPNIIAIRGHGRAGPWCWLLMDLVDGANLREVVATGRLSPAQTLALVPPLCAALQYAHDRGVVHRDIKPENILLDAAGVPRLADFGLAKLRSEVGGDNLTASGAVLGTVHYMAPEQVEQSRTVDHRADIYGLGVVIYELLTGRLPIGRFEVPSQKVQVDVRIDEVVLKALERDPERRWQQAGQVRRAVEEIDRTPTQRSDTPMGRQGESPAFAASPESEVRPWGMTMGSFNQLLHLSHFANAVVPGAGWVMPLVMWLTCRDLHPGIDRHGRIVVNWIISSFIYLVVIIPLCFVLIGIPLAIALGLCGLIFPIIGAVKASQGEAWTYPLSIPFLGRGPVIEADGTRRSGSGSGAVGLVLGLGCLGVIVLVVLAFVAYLFVSPVRSGATHRIHHQAEASP